MTFLSRFSVDDARQHEWIACLWQGSVPASMTVRSWLYLPGEPRTVLLIWDGDDDARRWVDRTFGPFGRLHTEQVADATPGMAMAVDRDLVGFERWLRTQDVIEMTADEQRRQVELRRRGSAAASPAEAIEAARQWRAETDEDRPQDVQNSTR